MGADEEGTLKRLRVLRSALVDPKISDHKGRIVKTTGDGILIEFPSVVEAVACAVAVQRGMAERNGATPEAQRIVFRVGVNLGDIIIGEDNDIHGDGVNVAARLEAISEPGGICISGTVRDHIGDRLDLAFEDMGEQALKNIARPIRVYRVRRTPSDIASNIVPAESPPILALPAKPSIAVLPFQNMSGDSEQEYFADGIAEDIITLLSKSRGLFVIARNSTFTYKGHAVDVKTVGRELGVRYVLEGSVRRAGNRVRVTVQLIEAATGGHLWAERYDRDLTDIFVVQDEITASASAAILPTMERSEREHAARKPPDSLDAWECYHRGQGHLAKVEASENALAQDFFGRAIALDPGFAAAHAAMAFVVLTDAVLFKPRDRRQDLIRSGTEYARRSISLDPADAIGHGALALALVHMGRHAEAMTEADLAVSLDPNSAWAYGSQGNARAFGGRPREAIEPLKTAMRLSPFDPQLPFWQHFLARAYYWMSDYHEAVIVARQVCQTYPQFQSAYRTLLAGLGQTGQAEEAKRVMAEVIERFGERFQLSMEPVGPNQMEDRTQDREHLRDGYRKAEVIDE